MSPYYSNRPPSHPDDATAITPPPATCPVCRSRSISTTEKTPDVNSYWRCAGCGEVWNVGRRQTVRRDTTSWR